MPEQESTPTVTNTTTPQLKLVDVELTNQNVALNVIIGFITLGQQRGVYSIQESAKIWECIKMFQQPQQTNAAAVEQAVEEAVKMEVTD
jgi:hypothetical protein